MAGVYLSHTMQDAALARRLVEAFRARDTLCEVDEHRVGDHGALSTALKQTIDRASGLVVLASPAGCASPQVRAEVRYATGRGHGDGVAVLAWGQTRAELAAAWPELEALGCHILPAEPNRAELDRAAYLALAAARIGPPLPGELILDFDGFRMGGATGEHAEADVWVEGPDGRYVAGTFTAPLGPVEAVKLQWYLESYYKWPAEHFERRARAIVDQLPQWGAALWFALLNAAPALGEWLTETAHRERVLTLRMAAPHRVPPDPEGDAALVAGISDATTRRLVLAQVAATRQQGPPLGDRPPELVAQQTAANAAQARLLALPWEMLASDGQYLFHKAPPIAVRRVIVPREPMPRLARAGGTIRVLVVVARPEKAGLIDPRASAEGLIDAVDALGEAVELDFLRPPTVTALGEALRSGRYDALHFDGHGVYDPRSGLGYLCFEHHDPARRRAGEPELIDGARIRQALGDHRLPLAFLEACQTAQGAGTTDAAMASALLAAGAESVVAMSHSVLVTTATRFTEAFYRALADGRSVARATTIGRKALAEDLNRGAGEDPSALRLHDWHVPQLFQRGGDPVLVPGGRAALPAGGARMRAKRHATLPALHRHRFVGRLPERLALERALEDHRVALIVGVGGQGKTTLAAELGRWLVRCERFRAAAFVSVEEAPPVEGLLSGIGRALIGPGFAMQGVGEAAIEAALDEIGDRMARHPGLVIVDNFETLLPPPADAPAAEQDAHEPALLAGVLDAIWALCQQGESRVIITCREPLADERFKHGATTHVETLGGLAERDAIALVGQICRNEGVALPAEDTETADDAVTRADLVRAVGGHPRSLVLLPALLRTHGIAAVTADLHQLMAELEAQHPGERERSLLASVKLSLRRLEPKWRTVLPRLGLLRVGVSVPALGGLLEWKLPQVSALFEALAARGLGHIELGRNYLRFHPALAAVLEAELRATASEAAVAAAWARVVEVYWEVVGWLYERNFGQQTQTAIGLAVRELPNLLRALDGLAAEAGSAPARLGAAIDYAARLEGLLEETVHRRALAGIARRRAALAARQPSAGWSHARHLDASATADRLIQARRLAEALPIAQATAQQAQRAADTSAFPEAAYDCAQSLFTLGRVLNRAGRPQAGLDALDRAQTRFAALPGQNAARMATTCLVEIGDCLRAVGRLAAAATCYAQAIEALGPLGDRRGAAVAQGQLATVRLRQGHLPAALKGHQDARIAFEALGEPAAVATAWQNIGTVLTRAGRLAEAEDAYKQSIALRLKGGDRLGAAGSITELAEAVGRAGRLDEAIAWGYRAVEIASAEGHPNHESIARSNVAADLQRAGRLAEAAHEAQVAAEIRDALGLGAKPWKTWGILHNIARDRGDADGAAEARAKAIDGYRRYRAQGGAPEPQVMWSLAPAQQAVKAGGGPAFAARVDEAIRGGQLPTEDLAAWRALAAFARGDRAAVRAAFDTFHYSHVVEFELLLAGQWPDPTAA